jgi:predicted lipoprotein with Yx(FWY)xxD motif
MGVTLAVHPGKEAFVRTRLIRLGLPVFLAAVAAVGAATAMSATGSSQSSGTVKTAKGAFGTMLVAANGKTLYRYTLDRKGVNKCTSNKVCAKYWPRLLVKPGTKPTAGGAAKAALLGTIKASGGMRQVTYAGFPLYFFSGDSKAGQTKGQAFLKEWYVVNTKGAFVKHAIVVNNTTTTTSSSSSSSAGGGWG